MSKQSKVMRFLIVSLSLLASVAAQAQTVYTLDECRQMATSHNRSVQMAQEKVNVASDLKKAAVTYYLPNISATGAYLWTDQQIQLLNEDQRNALGSMGAATQTAISQGMQSLLSLNPALATNPLFASVSPMLQSLSGNVGSVGQKVVDAFETDTRNIFVGAVTLTQPIFTGGRIVEMNRMAKYAKEIEEIRLQNEKSSSTYSTDEAYWRVVSLVNKQKLAEAYLELLNKLDSDVEKSIAIGVATKADGLTVKVKLNEAEMTKLQVEDGVRLSKKALCQVIGLPLNTDIHLADEDMKPGEKLAQDVTVDVQSGVDNRNEIRQLEAMLNMAESNRRMHIARFMPTIGLTAGYVISNPNMLNGFENKFRGFWEVGVGVHVPITHFGERIHMLNAARNMRDIARLQLEDAKEKVELDITQASDKVNESHRREAMSFANLSKADENLKYANLSFEAGMIPVSTLMEAQTAWLKAHADAIDAMVQTKMSESYLQKSTGK